MNPITDLSPWRHSIMKKYLNVLLLLFCCASSLAGAECKKDCVLKNRSQDQECTLDGTPLTRCESYATYMKDDKKLNKEYQELIKKLSKEDIANLRKTQRSWLDWRLDRCEEADQHAKCDNGVCAGVRSVSMNLKHLVELVSV